MRPNTKPALAFMEPELLQDGWPQSLAKDAVMLTLESEDVYHWLIEWWAESPGNYARSQLQLKVCAAIQTHYAVFGQVPSMQYLLGWCGD